MSLHVLHFKVPILTKVFSDGYMTCDQTMSEQ